MATILSLPFVHCSRQHVHFNLTPEVEQGVKLDIRQAAAAAAEASAPAAGAAGAPAGAALASGAAGAPAAVPAPTQARTQDTLLAAYRSRCGEGGQQPGALVPTGAGDPDASPITWGQLPFSRFLRHLRVATGPPPKGSGGAAAEERRWVMGNGTRVMLFSKPANVVTTPYVSTNVRTDERAAWAALLLFRPHASAAELLQVDGRTFTSAVAALEALPRGALADEGWQQIDRLQRHAADEAELRRAERAGRQQASADAGFNEDDGSYVPDDGDPTWFMQEDDGFVLPDDDAGAQADAAAAATAAIETSPGMFFYDPPTVGTLRTFVATEKARRVEEDSRMLARYDIALAAGLDNAAADDAAAGAAANEAHQQLLQQLSDLRQPLTAEQLKPVDCAAAFTRRDSPEPGQLLMVLAGKAGTGKSKSLEPIIHFCRMQRGSRSVGVTAPTNSAAGLIHGQTINSLFGLDQSGTPKKKLDGSTLAGREAIKKEQDRLDEIVLLIIDEKSMLGLRLLDTLLKYYAAVFKGTDREHLPFGGRVHIILAGTPLPTTPHARVSSPAAHTFCQATTFVAAAAPPSVTRGTHLHRLSPTAGDFYQLPPVKTGPLYADPKNGAETWAREMYKQHFTVFMELTKNFRQEKDPAFASICNNARFHTRPSVVELLALNRRFTTVEALLRPGSGLAATALWTAYRRKDVAALNEAHLQSLAQQGKGIVSLWALHHRMMQAGAGTGRRSGGGRGGRARGAGGRGPQPTGPLEQRELAGLLRFDPTFNDDGSYSDKSAFAPPPVLRLAMGSRVRAAENICAEVRKGSTFRGSCGCSAPAAACYTPGCCDLLPLLPATPPVPAGVTTVWCC